MTFTATLMTHLSHHSDLGSQPDLVETLLADGQRPSAARILADTGCTDDQRLRAAKILTPTRASALGWDEFGPIADLVLPPLVQRQLAGSVTRGLHRLAPNFTDSKAFALLAARTLPANPPATLHIGQSRDRRPGAMALEALLNILENGTEADEALMQWSFIDKALDKLCTAYDPSTEYGTELTQCVLTLGARHLDDLTRACREHTMPWHLIQKLSSRTNLNAELTTLTFDAIVTRLQTHPLWDYPTWTSLRHITPQLNAAQKTVVLDYLRPELPTMPGVQAGLIAWRAKMLGQEAADTTLDTSAPLADLLPRLARASYQVSDDAHAALLARVDLPTDVAVKLIGDRQVNDALLASIHNPDVIVAWLLAGAGHRFSSVTRLIERAGLDPAGRTTEDRLDLVVRVVSEWARTHGQGDETAKALNHVSLERLGRDRILALPWWVLYTAAIEREGLRTVIADALAEPMLAEATRPALMHVLEDAHVRRTGSSLADLLAVTWAATA